MSRKSQVKNSTTGDNSPNFLRTKLKNGNIIVTYGFTEREYEMWLKERFTEFSNQMDYTLGKRMETTITKLFDLQAQKIFAETYKEHCKEKKDFKFELDELKNQQKSMIEMINDYARKYEKMEKGLKEFKESLNEDINGIYRLCEDILDILQSVYLLLKGFIEKNEHSDEAIPKLNRLIANYITVAEKAAEETRLGIKTNYNLENEILKNQRLNSDKIILMLTSIKEKISVNNSNQLTTEIISDLNVQLEEEIKVINNNIKSMNSNVLKLMETSSDTQKRVTQIATNQQFMLKQVDKILSELQEVNEKKDVIESSSLRTEYDQKQKNLQKQLLKITFEDSDNINSEETSFLSCPFCGFREQRRKNNSKYWCTLCENSFIDVDPNMYEMSCERVIQDISHLQEKDSQTQMERVEKWKKLHRANLEKVSEDIHPNLYRIKLDEYTVSNSGVLIIPSTDNSGNEITNIAYCQPNTNDDKTLERFSQVRNLFFEGAGVSLQDNFDGHIPFSNMNNLEKVMMYDTNDNCFKEDKTIIQVIKAGRSNA